jgi:hypothetical protein
VELAEDTEIDTIVDVNWSGKYAGHLFLNLERNRRDTL